MEKKQLNTRQLLKDLAVILGGSIVGALGSKLLFSSAMGVAPIFMVDEGICKIFHVSLGTAIWSVCAIFLLLGLLLGAGHSGCTGRSFRACDFHAGGYCVFQSGCSHLSPARARRELCGNCDAVPLPQNRYSNRCGADDF